MRFLHVLPSATWSTWDVAMGYQNALTRAGIESIPWPLHSRLNFVGAALQQVDHPAKENQSELARLACETVVHAALLEQVDWLLITSAMSFHPDALVTCRRAGIKTAVIFTESPYSDSAQAYMTQFCDLVATNDRHSAEVFGWLYLPPAFDPAVHHPMESPPDTPRHDVVICGTGWNERVDQLAAIDWTGIDLGIYGFWPQLQDTPEAAILMERANLVPNSAAREQLGRFCAARPTTNAESARLYAAAKVALNSHRADPRARTWNPRAVEVLAVGGALLLTDHRPDLARMLGPLAPRFAYRSPKEMSERIRTALDDEPRRRSLVEQGRVWVQGESFDARVATLLAAMTRTRLRRVPLVPV